MDGWLLDGVAPYGRTVAAPETPRRLVVAVCLGNICRSPIAEAVLRARFAAAGLDDVEVISAGTGAWHVGEDADPRAREVLARRGYPLAHRAQRFDPAWFERADLVLAMDDANLEALRRLAPDAGARARVRLLRSFDPDLAALPETDARTWVQDPYYGGPEGFDDAVDSVEAAAAGVIAALAPPR